MATRKCTGTTKRGKPCKAPPRDGKDTCISHAPKEEQESAGFGGAQEGAGRPRVDRPTEVAQRIVEQNMTAVLAPFFHALGLQLHEDGTTSAIEGAIKHVWVNGETIEVIDLGARIQAAEKLLDRIYGKPTQRQEHTGGDGGPIQLAGELADPKVKEALFNVARAIDARRGD